MLGLFTELRGHQLLVVGWTKFTPSGCECRYASYANPSEFEPPKFRSEGRRCLRPRSGSGACPLHPRLYRWERGRTSSTRTTSSTLAQHEQAIIPAENPPNACAGEGVASDLSGTVPTHCW